ncbi:MAG: hypothetical protein LAP21_14920 [Acidobacteriia bacterium]|nr:hypothetical protein [Terriglobia bacterium]
MKSYGTLTNQALHGGWFFGQGEWKPPKNPLVLVKVARVIGSGTEDSPQFWALRYEHPDREFKFRLWTTDVGITALGATDYQVSVSTVHWLRPGYVGQEPAVPTPSAPGLLPRLLQSQDWIAWAGDQRLTASVVPVRVGAAHEFVSRIESADRRCPLVLVSRDFQTDNPLINSIALAKVLTGSTVVFESESRVIDQELEHLLDRDYQCANGMVRVYQPGIKLGNPHRHRYFTRGDVADLGADAVIDMLVRGIARRSGHTLSIGVGSIEDVEMKQREEKLARLKQTSEKGELLKLFEEDNQKLNDRLCGLEDALESQTEQIEELNDDLRRLEFEKRTLETRALQAEEAIQELADQTALLDQIDEFPATISGVVDLIAKAYPKRIAFTPKALASAKVARLKNADLAWQCLRAMATRLHRLHFKEKMVFREIIKRFRDETGFEIAAAESHGTKNNKDLAALRKGVFNGRQLDFSPHVKIGRDPGKELRVHYAALQDEQLIVVGHCGDHLDLRSSN